MAKRDPAQGFRRTAHGQGRRKKIEGEKLRRWEGGEKIEGEKVRKR